MVYEIALCKNEKCSQLVPPNKNRGRKREYCSLRCKSAKGARDRYARENGSTNDSAVGDFYGLAFVRRTKAITEEMAEGRFRKHLVECPLSAGGPCKSRNEPYDQNKLCLIHAVLQEDWAELRRKSKNIPYKRKMTTDNGFWADEVAENEELCIPQPPIM